MAVSENIVAASLDKCTRFIEIDRRKVERFSEEYRERLRIATPSIHQKALNLSGGNQQKVVIAKWLLVGPKVLIVDEPTRGIDVGAKLEIYAILRELREAGTGVIVISSGPARGAVDLGSDLRDVRRKDHGGARRREGDRGGTLVIRFGPEARGKVPRLGRLPMRILDGLCGAGPRLPPPEERRSAHGNPHPRGGDDARLSRDILQLLQFWLDTAQHVLRRDGGRWA